MYIDDITGTIITCAEAEGWKVDASIYYKDMTSHFEFSKFSPAGRDFSFGAEMKGAKLNSLIEHLEDYYENFDVDYETYIWLDQWGHGKNGAPCRLRAVLEDSEAIEKMVEALLKAINKMEVPEEKVA